MTLLRKSWGWAPGTWGELIQGEKNGQRLLIGLPSERGTTAYASLHRRPYLVQPVVCCQMRWKAKKAVQFLLAYFGESQVQIRLKFTTELKSGVGNASSSADVFSAMKATLNVLGRSASPDLLCKIASLIEPTNPTLISGACLFEPDKGLILGRKKLPPFQVIPLSTGKTIDTIHSRNVRPRWTKKERSEFSRILVLAQNALEQGSSKGLAQASTRSAFLHAERYARIDICKAWTKAQQLGALGIAASHSGSGVVALLPKVEFTHV
ncbi:MAG: hypothetical protein ACON4U_20845 [Myxococcota bacterium]